MDKLQNPTLKTLKQQDVTSTTPQKKFWRCCEAMSGTQPICILFLHKFHNNMLPAFLNKKHFFLTQKCIYVRYTIQEVLMTYVYVLKGKIRQDHLNLHIHLNLYFIVVTENIVGVVDDILKTDRFSSI